MQEYLTLIPGYGWRNQNRRPNKGRSLKFREGSQVRQTPEEGRWTYQPKRCGNNNKDEDISPKTLNDKNQANYYYYQLETTYLGKQMIINK